MKKILIVSNNMNVGGIQKSLLELLKVLAKEKKCDVSLFLCNVCGEYLQRVPSNIKILGENKYALLSELSLDECKKKCRKLYFFRFCFSLWSKLFSKEIPAKILCRLIGKLGDYDMVISYSQPIEDKAFCGLTNEIALYCVKAKKKATFVHCDFGEYGGNTKRNRKLYEKFDVIAAVSDSVGRRFCEIAPKLSRKVKTVRNCCDYDEIVAMAKEEPLLYNQTTVVTVARLSAGKGLIRCVPIFARLKREGIPFEWHIVGSGSLKNALMDEIAKYGLEKMVILEGEQANPYRFMKNADYFLLPSFHEAAPMVFDEACSLKIPILTTETLSAVELVEARGIGVVCENSEEGIYEMLKKALTDGVQCETYVTTQNELCLKQFYEII